jgi:DNA-binding helix-hairpin-helix protein with protein kinase domain
VTQARKDAGPEGFQAHKAEFARIKDELEGLPQAEQKELVQLHASAQDRQKQKFLETCFIDRATISGVGPARKAALRSFGIETAADVNKRDIARIRGFGDSLTRAILDWRRSCEQRFRFNPATAVSQADKDAVRRKFAAKRVSLERALAAGPADLTLFRQRASTQVAGLVPQLDAAARRLAQAEADYSVV